MMVRIFSGAFTSAGSLKVGGEVPALLPADELAALRSAGVIVDDDDAVLTGEALAKSQLEATRLAELDATKASQLAGQAALKRDADRMAEADKTAVDAAKVNAEQRAADAAKAEALAKAKKP